MNRRIFCKSAALSYFLLPFLSSKLFANTKGSGIFLGELVINGKKTNSQSIELGDAIVQSGAKQAVLKANDDVFLIRPFSKIKIIANQLAEIVEGSIHGVFGKREEELLIKTPSGTLGIRGTAIYFEIDTQKQSSSLCNCFGHTVVYGKNGKLLKSLKNTKENMHSAVTITNENVITATKFKHDVVAKEFLKK